MREPQIELIQGDITDQDLDAIVNAANSGLLGGGGVDGAIHRAGGPEILAECKTVRAREGRCPTGRAVITCAGRLRARRVIHTVGPVWHGGTHGEPELLASCHRESLRLAREAGSRSVAFPAISCGIYGYPVDLAAPVALGTVKEEIERHTGIDLVRFVLFDEATYQAFAQTHRALLA